MTNFVKLIIICIIAKSYVSQNCFSKQEYNFLMEIKDQFRNIYMNNKIR